MISVTTRNLIRFSSNPKLQRLIIVTKRIAHASDNVMPRLNRKLIRKKIKKSIIFPFGSIKRKI